MPASRFSARLFLPLLIFVGVLLVGVRVSEVFSLIHEGHLLEPAFASTAAPAPKPAEKKQETPPAPKEEKADPAPAQESKPTSAPSSPESALYQQLQGRREQLDKRAHELDEREALLRVAEQRVDQKVKEMEALRGQLQTMVEQIGGAQAAQIENLVKIYEIMKPKEAAKIFESLDMPIVLGVLQKMKPARASAIMAEMTPVKAKDITTALTKQDQMPEMK